MDVVVIGGDGESAISISKIYDHAYVSDFISILSLHERGEKELTGP